MSALDQAIASAGNATRLADLLGCHKSRVSVWRVSGIPADYAREIGRRFQIPPDVLLEATAPLDGVRKPRPKRRVRAA